MYWRQLALAATGGTIAGYLLFQNGVTPIHAGAAGVIVIVVLRWLFATVGRTRYWVRTDGHRSWNCPNCGQYIYRTAGDWVLECKRCGWRAGWPLVRWITHSVPVQQAWRSITVSSVVLILVAVFIITAGVPPISLSFSEEPTPTPDVEIKQRDGSAETADQQSTSLNETQIALYIAEFTNNQREDRGLTELAFDTKLTTIARYHSRDMAQNDYYAHDSPGGETMEDRYQQFDYTCQVPVGGNRFLSGAENIAYTYHHEDVRESDGDTVYLTTEREIAQSLVEEWMNSPGHRENILMQEWDDIGVGIAIDGDRVYATQNFC